MTFLEIRDYDGGGVRRFGADTDYTAFRAARERYLAHIRADAEARRLESAWRLPPPDRGGLGHGRRPT